MVLKGFDKPFSFILNTTKGFGKRNPLRIDIL